MEQEKMGTVNWEENEFFGKLNIKPIREKYCLIGLCEKKLIYSHCSIPESRQHSSLQHCIVVDFKLEHNSLSEIGSEIEAEDLGFADIAIIPAHTDYWSTIESEVSEAIVLSIEPDLLKYIASEKIETNSIELKAVFSLSDTLIQSIALNIKKELDSRICDRAYVDSLLQALLMHLLKNYCTKEYLQASSRGLSNQRLKQVIDYIEQNLHEKIEIKDLAKLVGVSQYYFCRLFRESTGTAPYGYVIQRRICKAKKLIAENKLSLLNIAIECGFSSQSQMTYHFGKLVGITPKVYRDRVGKIDL